MLRHSMFVFSVSQWKEHAIAWVSSNLLSSAIGCLNLNHVHTTDSVRKNAGWPLSARRSPTAEPHGRQFPLNRAVGGVPQVVEIV